MAWTDGIDFSAGETPTAAKLDSLANNFSVLGPLGDPTAVTSDTTNFWGSTGTAPALVNGTCTRSYRQTGPKVEVRMTLTCGSSTTYGSGVYTFALPVTPATGGLLQALLYDSGSSVYYTGLCYLSGTTTRAYFGSGTTAMSPTVPITLASGDVLYLAGVYAAT
jgi:hypothetical protein